MKKARSRKSSKIDHIKPDISICPHPLFAAMQDITKMSIDGLVEKAQEIKARQGEIGAIHTIFIEPDNLDKMSPAERCQLKAERTGCRGISFSYGAGYQAKTPSGHFIALK